MASPSAAWFPQYSVQSTQPGPWTAAGAGGGGRRVTVGFSPPDLDELGAERVWRWLCCGLGSRVCP